MQLSGFGKVSHFPIINNIIQIVPNFHDLLMGGNICVEDISNCNNIIILAEETII